MKTNIVEITVRNQTIIRSRPLYQWDSGQILRVVDQDIPDGTEIQFGNSFMREAIPAFFLDNQVKIPQAAMEQPMEIKAYMMIVSEDNETTTKLVRIPIIPKPKPCEYVPEEEEASILQIIQSKVDKSGWTPDMYLGTDEDGNVVEVKGGGGGVSFITDETLTLENGILSVNTADAAEADNTLPITSAAVATEIGNIDALLKTI